MEQLLGWWKAIGKLRERESSLPLFQLPQAPRYRLERAPLVQAIAQVRYPLLARLESMAGIAPLQEALRTVFPYMEQETVQEVSFVVGPAGPAAGASDASITWKLTNDSGNQVVVGAGSASLSAGTSYTTVEDFSADLEHMLNALISVGVPRCDRLGVRYLSVAQDLPGECRSWRRWFKPELLGWAGSDHIDDGALETAVNQVMLRQPPIDDLSGPPADIQATVRHGAVPAQTQIPSIPPLDIEVASYLIDVDVFSVGRQPFKPELILDQFEVFHRQIDQFFYWSLTEEGAKHFGMVNDS